MKILITNDDSVTAAQLIPLIRWCQRLGDVTVVVPKHEQSAKSHSIEIRKAFEIKQMELEPGITVWTVDSTPADCVRFAVSGLKMEFDLVISGINRGYNLGQDILYSGTMAAASEAVNKGIKALALSTSMKYYGRAVNHLEEIFRYIEEHDLFAHCDLYNINIPVDPKGFRLTAMGGPSFQEAFLPMENGLYMPAGDYIKYDGSDLTLDVHAVAAGYISVTPMTTNRTNRTVLEKLL